MNNVENSEISVISSLAQENAALKERLRKQLLYELYYQLTPVGSTLEELNRHYCYDLLPDAYNIILLRAVRKEAPDAEVSPFILSEVSKRMYETLRPVFHELETAVVDGRVICLFNITTHRDSPETDLFKRSIGRFFADLSVSDLAEGHDFVMGEGDAVQSYRQLCSCVQSASQVIRYAAVYGLNRRYDSYEHAKAYDNLTSVLSPAQSRQIRHDIESLDYEDLEALVDELFDSGYAQAMQFPGYAYLLPHKLIDLVASVIRDLIQVPDQFTKKLDDCRQRIDDCISLRDLKTITKAEIRALYEYYAAHVDQPPVIMKAKTYIRKHYKEKLYLADIADQVQLNSQYFSSYFKQVEGVSVTDFITSVRMEHAKAELTDTTNPCQQIAENVGYEDAHYFSRVFRKQVGMSPMEYRTRGKG